MAVNPQHFLLQTIGIAQTPYAQKFAIPRQASVIDVPCQICLDSSFGLEAIEELASFSHIWVLSYFHHIPEPSKLPGCNKPSQQVRPPRLGGNQQVGVFASRSPFRPNPIGLSLTRYFGADGDKNNGNRQIILNTGHLDLVNGTPIVDIKPYLPYADVASDARAGYAPAAPGLLNVEFTAIAQQQLHLACEQTQQDAVLMGERIARILAHDPRPATHHIEQHKVYGASLYGFNIRFQVMDRIIGGDVLQIQQVSRLDQSQIG